MAYSSAVGCGAVRCGVHRSCFSGVPRHRMAVEDVPWEIGGLASCAYPFLFFYRPEGLEVFLVRT